MGLAAPKNKNKISQDPNNNAWSRSTDRFGHRMLTSQGWTPGTHLGAKDARHAKHYTAASVSHIRVLLKDDNLGLGARLGGARAESFGLNVLQGLLGRLNGKGEAELKKEEGDERDRQLKLYQGQRWGHMNFIRGGYLIGDSIKKTLDVEDAESVEAGVVEMKSKKRKTEAGREESLPSVKRLKKQDKSEDVEAPSRAQSKSTKKQKTNSKALAVEEQPEAVSGQNQPKSDRKRRKAERREAKMLRRQQRTERKASKTGGSDSSPTEQKDVETALPSSMETQPQVVAIASAKPSFNVGRHAVRQRYIRQKQMASMDAQALKEIFMITAPA